MPVSVGVAVLRADLFLPVAQASRLCLGEVGKVMELADGGGRIWWPRAHGGSTGEAQRVGWLWGLCHWRVGVLGVTLHTDPGGSGCP